MKVCADTPVRVYCIVLTDSSSSENANRSTVFFMLAAFVCLSEYVVCVVLGKEPGISRLPERHRITECISRLPERHRTT